MTAERRHGPTGGPTRHLIDRPRLDRLLLGRFEQRVTVISAPAGSGKTSALALAVENNRLDPRGVDVFVGLSSFDDSPLALLERIMRALGIVVDVELDTTTACRRVVDAVWTHAPDEVAVILDDVHLVDDPDARRAIEDLVEILPDNGHLVLASRRQPPIPIARLRAHRRVLEIDQDELGFDDDELDELRTARSGRSDVELPRHAASADLRLALGVGASTDFLREEIVASLDPDRLDQLRRVSVLDEFDAELVLAMTDGRFDVDTLLADLPLVEHRSDGTFRLHALLREALLVGWNASRHRKASSVAADLLAERGRHGASIRLHLAASDEIAARDVARAFISSPTLRHTMPEVREVTGLVETIDDDGPLVSVLRAARRFAGLVPESIEPMRSIADDARRHGDSEIEALALHRAFQAQFFDLDLDDIDGPYLHRLVELADELPFAKGALAHVRSQSALHRGDAQGAWAALDDYDGLGEESRIVTVNQRLCDLGRVEEVGLGLTPDDLAGLPEGSEVFIAFAMWLRGEESPEFAHEFVAALLPELDRRGQLDTIVSALGVATSIALAAGDVAEARRRAEWAADLARVGTPRTATVFAQIAAASVAAVVDSDDAAAALLDEDTTGISFGSWPQRGHLLALPLLYATRPETREVLDSITLGPALTTAVRAGRALVALRDGDPRPAREIPWSQAHVLRVHVLPHHLVELACAAAHDGSDAAADLLQRIPDLDRHLGRVATTARAPARTLASELLGRRRPTAPSDLTVDLLGPIRLFRDGVEVTDDDWTRRARVRELLALLCARRHLTRLDVLAEMWSGHDDDAKADANLRSTLSRLQRVLEPDRSGTDPYFLRSDGDVLTLHGDVTTDVDRFERTLARARQADEAGSPARALDVYTAAIAAYRGEYLLGVDAGWTVLTRMRLQSLAVNALCRIGELTAARGHPEAAAGWAQQALEHDPLSQRAASIFVSALAASGDIAGARAAGDSLEAGFLAAGIEVERSTRRVFDRFR